ncbi:MAG: hypothetical protein QXL88_00510 [Candidatus Pacearchaeota archaeon]
MNKRGAEINITTIIIIILAILVLVILALYFTGGMKSLWEQITIKKAAWDTSSINEARGVCDMICSGGSGNRDKYCAQRFNIKKGNETVEVPCYGDPIHAERYGECKKMKFECTEEE